MQEFHNNEPFGTELLDIDSRCVLHAEEDSIVGNNDVVPLKQLHLFHYQEVIESDSMMHCVSEVNPPPQVFNVSSLLEDASQSVSPFKIAIFTSHTNDYFPFGCKFTMTSQLELSH